MTDLLIRGGTVVSMDPGRRIIPDGCVAITGDRIAFVGPATEGPIEAATVLDAEGGIILPGLIDAHGHGGHGLLKTIASDSPSFWGKVVTGTYYHHTDVDYWSAEGQLSALERLMFGVTTGLCVIASEPRSDDPELAGAHAAAYAEAGLREGGRRRPLQPAISASGQPLARWQSDGTCLFLRRRDGRSRSRDPQLASSRRRAHSRNVDAIPHRTFLRKFRPNAG